MLSRFSCVQLFATLWTTSGQAPLSSGFSRCEYWSELPCSFPGDLPDSGIEPVSLTSPALAGVFFTISTICEAQRHHQFSSIQFSHSVMSDSLQPHQSQHTRPPCPSPTPRVYSDSCPLSQWCHPAISSSVVPLSPTPNPSQNQGIFQWVISSHEVAKVFEFQLQHQYFQWTSRTDRHIQMHDLT